MEYYFFSEQANDLETEEIFSREKKNQNSDNIVEGINYNQSKFIYRKFRI